MKPLETLLKALVEEAKLLTAKAQNDPSGLTEDEVARSAAIVTEYNDTKAKIEAQKALVVSLSGVGFLQESEPIFGELTLGQKTWGQQFIGSDSYKGFKKQFPSGVAKGAPVSLKSRLVSKLAPDVPLNTHDILGDGVPPFWTDDMVYRPGQTFLDLITKGTTAETYIPYRQVIEKVNNAGVVPEARDMRTSIPALDPQDPATTNPAIKPLSSLVTQPADAKVYTYADGMVVTTQELSDDGVIQTLIDSTLRENLQIELERVLLFGGAGGDDEPKGLFETTGVLQQDFTVDAPTTVRKAMTRLQNTSTRIQAVVMNPSDDEAWDLMKDLEGRYMGAGPFSSGPSTAWGVPRIVSQALPAGTAVLGDFSTIHLLQREALAIEAFNQHADFARLNLIYVRAELRAMQLFRKPAALVLVDLTA